MSSMFVCLGFLCFLSFPESSSNGRWLFVVQACHLATSLSRACGGRWSWVVDLVFGCLEKSLLIITQLEEFRMSSLVQVKSYLKSVWEWLTGSLVSLTRIFSACRIWMTQCIISCLSTFMAFRVSFGYCSCSPGWKFRGGLALGSRLHTWRLRDEYPSYAGYCNLLVGRKGTSSVEWPSCKSNTLQAYSN